MSAPLTVIVTPDLVCPHCGAPSGAHPCPAVQPPDESPPLDLIREALKAHVRGLLRALRAQGRDEA